MKLYTVQYVAFPLEACDVYASFDDLPDWLHGNTVRVTEDIDSDLPAVLVGDWQPRTWPERSVELYGEVKPFFWPSTKPIYRSRSAAQARADLIESYGAKAVVLVTDTKWETFDERNARIAEDKREKRIATLRDQLAALEGVPA